MEFGCEQCYAENAVAAWDAFRSTKLVVLLVDDSHFSIRIRNCAACGQHYLSVFTETIDWQDGEDPQLWSIIPVNGNEISLFDIKPLDDNEYAFVESVRKFSPERKSLCLDWPKGSDKKIFWRQGIIVGLHD